MDIFVLNTQELAHGWKVFDYISYQNYRFNMRDARWTMESRAVDGSLSEYLQTVDMLCFSSQYFFVVSVHVWGVLLMLLGIVIMFSYSAWGAAVARGVAVAVVVVVVRAR